MSAHENGRVVDFTLSVRGKRVESVEHMQELGVLFPFDSLVKAFGPDAAHQAYPKIPRTDE